MQRFFQRLWKWYGNHARNLPWRDTSNPYQIWVSEVILQQTRVAQGIDYYHNFIFTFPDIASLAHAPEEKILKIWQGLGYYSRARNMQAAARLMMDKYGGNFPVRYSEIAELPGVGPYTAAAIASFAFGLPYPAVDGNVKRVVARLFALHEPVQSAAFMQQALALLQELMPGKRAADFNQAMIELGATLCSPRNPACDQCPVAEMCEAHRTGTTDRFPVTRPKKAAVKRYHDYLFLESKGETWLQKRPEMGIWAGLYEFPVHILEYDAGLSPLEIFGNWFYNPGEAVVADRTEFTHLLTHQTIFARFWHLCSDRTNIVEQKNCTRIAMEEIETLPVHRLMHKYLEKKDWRDSTEKQ
ncbi:MAG: A/G-specific adenine glycosylase [Bacteroidetes bacterium]|nr:A/G-specific adenine glycosylase [Bacteroidota bacterium]